MPLTQPDPQQQQLQHAVAQPLQQPAQQGSAFPLKEILLSSGVLSVIGMFYFYKKKQTLPFKACYGLMWPTLGVGTILAVTPSQEQMSSTLQHSRAVTTEDLRKQKEANATMRELMLKQYAHK